MQVAGSARPGALRARLLLRQQFGDLGQARDVLDRLTSILDVLDQPEPELADTDQPTPAPGAGRRKTPQEE
jgi:hypothetical protein